MTITESKLIDLIKQSGLADQDEISNARRVSQHLGVSMAEVLLGRSIINEEQYGQLLSKHFGKPFINLNNLEFDSDTLNLIPEEFATEKNVIAFNKENQTVHIALEDPKDFDLIETVKKTIGARNVKVFVTTAHSIKESLKAYKTSKKINIDEDVVESSEDSAVALVNKIIEKAVREEASDVHIEALDNKMLIRLRIDGVLHDEGVYHKNLHAATIARIKILSDLKLDETRLPQDGQFAFKTKSGESISLRVSTTPTVKGEKCVLRLLKSTIAHFNLEELGLMKDDMEKVAKSIQKTHGMFLVTGPTGSGKTTTLYTILGLLNKPDVNIITIEDPVENKINRINQIQVNPNINLTFASGLRSILRQDPDVILVGEIRDHETAQIAVNSAMTGHLVFSTVHANSAVGAIPRMIDLGMEPFLLASTLNMVVAQRLVRVLCPKCKKLKELSSTERSKLKEYKDSISPKIMNKLKKNYIPVGCQFCFNTGYKGRAGIFEFLNINDHVKDLIVEKSSSQKIAAEMKKNNYKTMLEDGLDKVINGTTSLQEVFRVISQ